MPRVAFDTNSVHLEQYQIGYGDYNYFKGLDTFQRGYGRQRGAGLGDVLKSLWRAFLPVLKSTGEVVGKEALSTGSRILGRVAEGENLKDTLKKESVQGIDNLLEKHRQRGKGIKGIRKHSKTHVPIKSYIGKRVNINLPPKRKRSDAFGLY